jgi:DNA recombination protein RmuC
VISTAAFIAIAAGLVAVGAVLFHLVSQRSRESASRLDRVLVETAAAREASESVDRRFEELRRTVELRVQGIERGLLEGQKGVADHLASSGRLLSEVGEKVGRVFEASQKIERLAGEVTRLEDLLKPPKLRGALGETFLEQALRQVLPPGSWKMQHAFADGVVVDAVILIGDRFVPVDSKFPLENFRRSRELEDEGERRKARRAFAADVRRHVDGIAEKYVRPGSGTYDFALMYVPAEAVYCEIAADEEDTALADYAVGKRVVAVSPRLLYAYLSTIALGLRGLELQENAREIHENLADLSRLLARVEEPMSKLGTHLTNAAKQYE